jgi:DNA-binding response OmpR family regulator
MKLLLALGSDDNFDIISRNLRPLGFELIRYQHILKAMDNIDEINPTAIIVSARDFPRHWKILVQFVRSGRSKETCPIIVLKGENFTTEEASKAFFLGVSSVIDDSLANLENVDRLRNILSRHVPVNERRKYRRYDVEAWHQIGFVIVNFIGKSIITGDVKTISTGGLSFFPSVSLSLEESMVNNEFDECSLRVGNAILSPVCRLIRIGRIISLEFLSLPAEEQRILEQFLESMNNG